MPAAMPTPRDVVGVRNREVAQVDHELRWRRQRRTKATKQLRKDWDHEYQQDRCNAHGDGDDRRWVDHCPLDLALEPHRLFHVARKAVQDAVQNTADFTGGDHVHEQIIEQLWVLAQRIRKG